MTVVGATLSTATLADGTTVDTVRGEVDVDSRDRLSTCLVRAIHDSRPPRLIVDLLHVTFIDSVGISALLSAHRSAHEVGVRFTVRHPSDFVARQLRVTGVYDTLTGRH